MPKMAKNIVTRYRRCWLFLMQEFEHHSAHRTNDNLIRFGSFELERNQNLQFFSAIKIVHCSLLVPCGHSHSIWPLECDCHLFHRWFWCFYRRWCEKATVAGLDAALRESHALEAFDKFDCDLKKINGIRYICEQLCANTEKQPK